MKLSTEDLCWLRAMKIGVDDISDDTPTEQAENASEQFQAPVLIVELEGAGDGRLLISGEDWMRVLKVIDRLRQDSMGYRVAAERWCEEARDHHRDGQRWRRMAWVGAALVFVMGLAAVLCGGIS